MIRLSVNEMTTYRWSFEEDVAHYAAAGIPAIGVWRQKLSDFGDEKGAVLLEESGLRVSNLLWAGGFTGSDGRNLRESVEDAIEAIRLAGDLKCDCVIVYTGGRAGHTHAHARRLVRDALKKLLPAAEEFGVDLAVEPMHPGCAGDCTFLTTLDDALSLIEAVNHPRVRLAVDTYHLGFDPLLIERIPSFASQIAVVHVGDGLLPADREQNRTLLGSGAVPLTTILNKIARAGYQGYYDVELIGPEIEAADYDGVLEHSKGFMESLAL